MRPGRNDPCPCGSGKKYKKCCLGKTAPVSEPKVHKTVEPRFFSPVSSHYTQAALAEALKPGGVVRIHPYVLVKLRDDPRLLKNAHMSQCLSNWSQDFRLESLSGSLTDARCGEIGLRFMRELLETWPHSEETANVGGDLAMLYFNLRRDAEAEQHCQRLIRDYPNRAVGYVTLADGLLRDSFKGVPDSARIQRAIDVLVTSIVVGPEEFTGADQVVDQMRLKIGS